MLPSIAFRASRRAPDAVRPIGTLRIVLIAALHGAALALMLWSEIGLLPKLVFGLTWGALNFFWLAVLRRPAVSAALSLVLIVTVILLSRLKYDIIWMTANFLDLMIVNSDTISFLLSIKPELYRQVGFALALVALSLVLLWRIDSFRVRARTAAAGGLVCATALVATALAFPEEEWGTFSGDRYVSKFARSGASPIA